MNRMKLTDEDRDGALLEAFRSSEPTPGGGSAAALAGAVGASLLAMVAGLPKPRAATDEDLERLRDAGSRCAGARAASSRRWSIATARPTTLVVAAYRLPKATDEEKAARAAAIQEALQAATTRRSTSCARAARRRRGPVVAAARQSERRRATSQVGLELLRAGLRGARLNVEINLGSVKDAGYVRAERHGAEDSQQPQ